MTTDEFHDAVDRAARSASEGSAALRRLARVLRIRCAECGAAWIDPLERWRAYRTDDPAEVVLFCPGCAEHEFGSCED